MLQMADWQEYQRLHTMRLITKLLCILHLLLFPLLILHPANLCGQTIYDMGEINGDLRILGEGRHDYINYLSRFDLDQSGTGDFIVCSPGGTGKISIFLDPDLSLFNTLIDLLSDIPEVTILGGSTGNSAIYPGHTLLTVDFNGDNTQDFFSSFDSNDCVFCYFGSEKWVKGTTLQLPDDPPDVLIKHEDGGPSSFYFGQDISSGDINNDGISDVLIGEYLGRNHSGTPTGAVHVVFGRESFDPPVVIDIFQTPADITIFGVEYADQLGLRVTAGDVNGDGIDDIVTGAGFAVGEEDCGRVYVVYGSDSFPNEHVIDLAIDQADIEIKGPHYYSRTGYEVAVCDLNGDGTDDICFNSPWRETTPENRGVVYVVFGRADFPANFYLDLETEEADLEIIGEVEEAYLGTYMEAGDMDGDGCEELVIAGYRCRERFQDEGVAYVIPGSPDYASHMAVDLSANSPSMKALGSFPSDSMHLLSEMTDVNEDGLIDLIVSAPNADREDDAWAISAGEIYVILSDGALFNPPRILASPGLYATNPPELRLYDPFDHDGWTGRFLPYLVDGYGLVTAGGDLDGDGYDEIVTGPGPGPYHPARVLLLDEVGKRLASFQAYATPRYGVNVACGDLDGDGVDEIVTGAGPGAVYGPHVRGWQWDGDDSVAPLPGVSFLAYGTNRWGVNVVCGDIDGDNSDEIITGAGPGDVFGPHVRGWDVDGGSAVPIPAVSYFAYGTLRWGVNVASGDIDGDGIAEIVTGPGPSTQFSSHVRGWNYDGEVLEPIPGVNFIAYSSFPHSKGCIVACGDVDNDRVAEILTAPGPHPDNPAYVKTWNYDGNELALVTGKSFLVFEEGGYLAGARIALGNPYQHLSYLP